MEELKLLWKRLEKRAIYISLTIYLALELVAMFIPSIASFMDARGALLLMALILLVIFRYLDEKLDSTKQDVGLTKVSTLVEGVVNMLKSEKEIKTVDLLAHSGYMYYVAIKESKVKIRTLRLLLRGAETPSQLNYHNDKDWDSQFAAEVRQHVKAFSELQKIGQISKLTIAYYSYEPTIHFMIINGKRLLWGLYKIIRTYPGIDILSCFTMRNNTVTNDAVINDFKSEFEEVWKHVSIK